MKERKRTRDVGEAVPNKGKRTVLSRKGESYFQAKDNTATFADPFSGDSFDEPLSRYEYDLGDIVGLANGKPRCSGFLVTCPFQREKSATVEAQRIIGRAARDKVSFGNLKVHSLGKCVMRLRRPSGGDQDVPPMDVVSLLETIARGVDDKEIGTPKFCQRFFPFEALCWCEEAEIEKAMVAILAGKKEKIGPKQSFSVGCKSRRIKVEAENGGNSAERMVNVVDALAKGFQSVFKEAPVNLKQPENIILCESVKVSQNRALIALCCVQAELADVRSRGTSIRTLARREKHKPPIETPNVK